MRRTWVLAVTALLVSACGVEGGREDASGGSGVDHGPVTVRSAVALERFDDCSSLLGHLRSAGRERVGPYGFSSGYAVDLAAPGAIAEERATTTTAADAAAAPAQSAGSGFSTTNIQEEAVDEPDIVKNDANRVLTVDSNSPDGRPRLVYMSVDDGRPQIAGRLDLPPAAGRELLLAGDRAIVLGFGGGVIPLQGGVAEDRAIAPGPQMVETVVTVVDVSDPSSMKVTDVLHLDGSYASARMVGGIARLVLNSQSSRLAFDTPTRAAADDVRRSLDQNRKIVADAPIDAWLPHFVRKDASGIPLEEGTVAACDSTYRPKEFSGFGTVSVVTIDPANPDPQGSATVLGDAGVVYASSENLYVATQRWPEPRPVIIEDEGGLEGPELLPPPTLTELHRFDISERSRAIYAASGQITGTILNQWSLSEHEGFLRVATTEDRVPANGPPTSSSSVTVLTTRGSQLATVGSVGGLGKGERIFGVRFIGDMGYVVTFRQIDPLHVIDLSEPTRPRVLGELKIPGYSAYLHPIGDGRLLGVGQDASEDGMRLGAQVSLFDVSDPNNPRQLDKIRLDNANSAVEHDHHAFLYWSAKSLAVVPVESYGAVSPDGSPVQQRSAAVGFRVTRDDLREVGRASHEGHADPNTGMASVQRSIVIGDTLFTLSAAGLLASDIDSFAERTWLPLG